MDSLKINPSRSAAPAKRKPRKFRLTQRMGKCEFCDSKDAGYTCSQCEVTFCSSSCFRCDKHRECSEHFYKKQVLEHLKHTKTDKEEQKRFLELLKRNSSTTNEDLIDYCDLLAEAEDLDALNLDLLKDPKLQEFSQKLIYRLSNSSDKVDNLEHIWLDLSEDERNEFVQLVNGNDKYFDSLISEWAPWWVRKEWQQVVLDQEDVDKLEEEDYGRAYPQMYTKFERLSKLTSKAPSPTIGTSLICSIFSYCHLCRLYNGEISCPEPEDDSADSGSSAQDLDKWTPEIVRELLRLCPLLDPDSPAKDKVLENPSQALDLSLSCLFGYEGSEVFFERKLTAIELLQDIRIIFDFVGVPGRQLVIRPTPSDAKAIASTLHAPKAIVLALSDLIIILERIQNALKKSGKDESAKAEVKRIELAKKKLQFYLSWTIECGGEVLEQGNRQLLQAIDLEIEKLKQENLLFEQENQQQQTAESVPKAPKDPNAPLIDFFA